LIKCGNGDQCLRIFGRTAHEILKALEFWDNASTVCDRMKEEKLKDFAAKTYNADPFNLTEQSKMTREEAENKIIQSGGEVRYGVHGRGNIVRALEALGLLKFDEPKKVCWRRSDNVDCLFPEGHDPNTAGTYVWTKVPKKQVEWVKDGSHCWFTEGFDPNKQAGQYGWSRVYRQQQPEMITIYVGSHSHDVSMEAIRKALAAKGYRIVPATF